LPRRPPIDTNKTPTTVARLVLDHKEGVVPTEGVLDSPEKVRGFVNRMKDVSRERIRENRRARQASAARARTRKVL